MRFENAINNIYEEILIDHSKIYTFNFNDEYMEVAYGVRNDRFC